MVCLQADSSVRQMIEEVSRLFDVQVQLEAAEIPAGIKHYVVDTWCDPGKFLAAGSLPIFAHHGENLRFIHWALTAMSAYWGLVEQIRRACLPPTPRGGP